MGHNPGYVAISLSADHREQPAAAQTHFKFIWTPGTEGGNIGAVSDGTLPEQTCHRNLA